MQQKIKKKHVDYSCGFPVILFNVPMLKVSDEWILDINYDTLAKAVLSFLAQKPGALTGNEIRFIRYYFGLTLRDFANRLGVKHPAIIKWEDKKDHPAAVTWGIEKDIRLLVLDKICKSNRDFRAGYKALEEVHHTSKIQPLKFEVQDGHLLMAG